MGQGKWTRRCTWPVNQTASERGGVSWCWCRMEGSLHHPRRSLATSMGGGTTSRNASSNVRCAQEGALAASGFVLPSVSLTDGVSCNTALPDNGNMRD
jgi:hypothetical protein